MSTVTDDMVDRFLSWPLPDSVCADLCATKHGRPHRTGTNLLSATEARAMLEHVLGSNTAVSDRQAELERVAREVILKLQLLPTGHDCCLSGTGGIQVIIELLADQRKAVLEEAASIAEADPELPGAMPPSVRTALESLSLEEQQRTAVRCTKKSIAKRIRQLIQERTP